MKTYTLPALLFLVALLCSCNTSENSPRTRSLFTADWLFCLGDSAAFAQPDFADDDWRQLTLPHDWAIEGEFSEYNPSGTGGGALPGGIGWYRKTFYLTENDLIGHTFIEFDGVYMNSTVFVNGQEVGHRPYGYISFSYEITKHLRLGANTIAVRVDNNEQPNSRWYSGCGIYRNVWLTHVSNEIYVDHWGHYVTTPLVNDAKADVRVATTVRNRRQVDVEIELVSTVIDPKGKEICSERQNFAILPDSITIAEQNLRIAQPQLWSIEAPTMYKVRTDVYARGRHIDSYTTQFGIRSFYFDARDGFILNNKNVKINGVCMHHDLGCLGSAVNRRAIERQLEILKQMGCNGIRCSHNPPAPELLELCDSMGFVVMDEAFDMWRKKKTQHDYSRYFAEWHERDLTDLVVRDRNHPSVFMWSIGNEVLEQWTDVSADTLSLEQANLLLNMKQKDDEFAASGELSVNSLLCQKLTNMVHQLDPTRPVTAGNNETSPSNHLFRAEALDIIGFNYHNSQFEDVPQLFPTTPFIVSESVSALMTRGYYRGPSDTEYLWPERWDRPFSDPSYACSSYDNTHAPWGNTHEETWLKVKHNDFICGQYIWTGFDYLGEPTPYGWPARSSYFGIVDLAGFPKDIYYMYQSEWTDQTVLHLFPHWNWKKDDVVDICCYYNNADEVELFVNGQSHGSQSKDSLHLQCMWRLAYEPGTISAVSRKDGKVVASQTINTAGRAAQLRATADRTRIKADGKDLSFVTIEVLDEDGNLCPFAENEIHFKTQGTAFIAGVDNGSQVSLESFKAPQRKVFYGKCLVVLQNDGRVGNAQVTASAEGLRSSTVTINCLGQKQY